MSVSDAKPQDIYLDEHGKLWRCIGTCEQPTVFFEEVEGRIPDSSLPINFGGAQAYVGHPPSPQIVKQKKSGGVGGLMWQGWRRIHRVEE